MANKENIKDASNEVVEESTLVEGFEKTGDVLAKGEVFLEDNQKPILIGLAVVAAIVVAIIAYFRGYREPRIAEAQTEIYKAELAFASDSFAVALYGNDNVTGFLDFIDEYSGTPSGDIAKAYAGICYKNLGNPDSALIFLNDVSVDDKVLAPAVLGAIGDCYWDMDDQSGAEKFYKKAVAAENLAVSPIYMFRLAMLYDAKGDKDAALKVLGDLQNQYPQTEQGRDAEKYIGYIKASK